MSNIHKMHPRNIFRNPPDYTELAIKYKEFRQVCKLELNGRVSVDYKSEEVLRSLTQTLLLEYYQLKVEFAPGSLVPTLPLRLNYLLWIEDLMSHANIKQQIHGIDIGCGSSCIYSLLAAKKNNWRMLGLESNETNIAYSTQNVTNNQLENLITIYKQTDMKVIFKDYFESLSPDRANEFYHFCLCNPPFYDALLPDPFLGRTRNPHKRAPPHNAHTGGALELACEGGEVEFVRRIILESELYKNRVQIFTSMLGHKQSLTEVVYILKERDITNISTTLFCQGNTTRWGVAWSFGDQMLPPSIK